MGDVFNRSKQVFLALDEVNIDIIKQFGKTDGWAQAGKEYKLFMKKFRE